MVVGGEGSDRIQASPWNDVIGLANVAGNLAGVEAIDGGGGSDTIRLTSGNDTLDLTGIVVTGVELIEAGAGSDTVAGSAAADVISGGAGDDLLAGGAGDDVFNVTGGAEGFDVVLGGDGFDRIQAGRGTTSSGSPGSPAWRRSTEVPGPTIRLTAGNDTLDLSATAVTGIEPSTPGPATTSSRRALRPTC